MEPARYVWVSDYMKPAVTILIDTYNHEHFIEEAIVSVLEQDFPSSEIEILVVDDGSTDRTPEIVRKFEPRVRLIRKANGGQASAFNVGIPEAKGEFIAFLDGDDWWARNKLSRALDTFAREPELGFVGHGDILVYPDGRRMLHALRESCRFRLQTLESALLFRRRGAFMGTCRMTVRANVLRQVLPIPEDLTIQADEYLFTVAAAICEVRILAEALFFYRIHDANAFQMSSPDPHRLQRKQNVLATLARVLGPRLRAHGVAGDAVRAITERIQAEADQLRLMTSGGWPWETVRTEWKIYGVLHPDAPPSHRIFKIITLLPAVAMAPRVYYGIQQQLSKSDLYLRARKRWLPIPEMTHIQKGWHTD
jgi:glycosyltransferase involved in cell wall biosynthesis